MVALQELGELIGRKQRAIVGVEETMWSIL